MMAFLTEVSISLVWLYLLARLGLALRPRKGPRHTWGELSSSDVANAFRRR